MKNVRGDGMRKLLRVAMPVFVGLTLLVIGTPSALRAQITVVPEIDPASGMAAMALLTGVVMMIRGRHKTSTDRNKTFQ
jgi:hypothetical protein